MKIKQNLYCQCLLTKNTDSETRIKVSYIPQKYAVLNNVLKLKNGSEWVDGWIVSKVYNEPIEIEISTKQSIKRHRNNTGDSLPKK